MTTDYFDLSENPKVAARELAGQLGSPEAAVRWIGSAIASLHKGCTCDASERCGICWPRDGIVPNKSGRHVRTVRLSRRRAAWGLFRLCSTKHRPTDDDWRPPRRSRPNQ